ncbi:MAG: Ig-like domain-containing protein [Bacteroidaceae bacterium]|nr:Ig-like domain-containing protein [Bacteroidaceae bacterium]
MKRNAISYLSFPIILLLLVGCASLGSPDGGPYDETPPKVVQCTPDNKATNNNKKKISILFDEYIKMENASEKVVVSPPQIEMPNIRAVGKKVRVDLFDTLQANTTYTVDFSDAIVDNNEGNPLGKYTYSFSTGPTIDTMEVSGTVLTADNLEPVKGILVGLYAADSTFHDSLFTSKPLIRVARTNGSGQFTIKGVKNGQYHVYAIKDMDNNYHFSQKSEVLAFDTITFSTSQRPDIRPDTVWVDTVTIDKIRMVPFIHYYPDNVVLRTFLEGGQDKHRLKEERKTPESFTLYFTAPMDSLPRIEGFGFDASKVLVPEPSLNNDTITYWITDTLVSYPDTISFALIYPDTDTLGIDQLRTDTLELVAKSTHEKLEKERIKKSEEWVKAREKKIKRAKEPLPYEENPFEVTYMTVQIKPSGALDPDQNITITFSEPISQVDTSRIQFYQVIDSDYVPKPYLFEPVEGTVRQYRLYAEWEPQQKYRLVADSLTFLSALGNRARSIKSDFRVRSLDEYGSFFVHLVGIEPNDTSDYIVQMLNKSDKPVNQLVAQDGRADFFYMKPGEYYMRLIIDRNRNGIWDTGDYNSKLQPEEVYYFPRPIPIRAKFEVEQDWNFRSIDLTKQKPKAITKQKADKEKTIKDKNRKREEEKRKQR